MCWWMPEDAWLHWAQGRGNRPIRDVILEEIDQIRKNPEAVRARCKAIGQEAQPAREVEQVRQHEIRIELPSGVWSAACRQVRPVSTGQLLGALILGSQSWRQDGDGDSEFSGGWYGVDLDASLHSLTATTAGLKLARGDRILARTVAVMAIVAAMASVLSALAAWCRLLAGS